MTTDRDTIIRIAREAGFERIDMQFDELARFAALVAAAKEKEMQDRLDRLDAMYEQVCQQRDQAMEMQMDMQRAYIAAMRGKTQ